MPIRLPVAPAASAWPCGRSLEIEESRAIAGYGEQASRPSATRAPVVILEHVIEEEKEHYREVSSDRSSPYGHYQAPGGTHTIDAKAVLDEMLAKRNQGRKQPGAWITATPSTE